MMQRGGGCSPALTSGHNSIQRLYSGHTAEQIIDCKAAIAGDEILRWSRLQSLQMGRAKDLELWVHIIGQEDQA